MSGLIALVLVLVICQSTASAFVGRSRKRTPVRGILALDESKSECLEADSLVDTTRRRAALTTLTSLLVVIGTSKSPVQARGVSPDTAFANLLKAKQELITAAKAYIPTRDYAGMREFFEEEATNMNNFEANSRVLLESKRLDAESKKEIGTIRRYGVGADVMIMYGGLRAEIDEGNEFPNFNEVQKYFTRTLDSLEEVIAICRNNGFA